MSGTLIRCFFASSTPGGSPGDLTGLADARADAAVAVTDDDDR
jgi:hypothetical protein